MALQPASIARTETKSRSLTAVLFALALFAIIAMRLLLAARWGTDLPFWDQWDAEISRLYKPLLDGTLKLGDLFAAHNEHRILLTRLLGLLLFWANDYQFDNRVEVFFNTPLYAAMLGLFCWPLLRRLRGAELLLGLLLMVVTGILPFAWENQFAGFQNCFYLLNIALIVSVQQIAFHRITAVRLGVLCLLAVTALFTLASGLTVAAVIALVGILLARDGLLAPRRALLLGALMLPIAVIGYLIVPRIPGHEVLRAASIADFLLAWQHFLSWPMPSHPLVALAIWTPCVAWLLRWLLAPPTPGEDDSGRRLEVFLVAIAVWVALQGAALALSRGHDMVIVATRYMDTLVFGALANLALAALQLRRITGHRGYAVGQVALASLGLALFTALTAWGFKGAASAAARQAGVESGKSSLRAYLDSNDSAAIAGKNPFELGYPNIDRLRSFLDDATIRHMLPASLKPPLAVSWNNCSTLTAFGAYPTTPARAGASGTFVPGLGNAVQGHCTSAALHTEYPAVRMAFAGYLGQARLSVKLTSIDRQQQSEVVLASAPREAWQTYDVRVPAPTFAIEASDDDPDFWFALASPVEQGGLSYWTQTAASWLNSHNPL